MPERRPVLDRAGYFAAYAAAHGGYDPAASPWARGYLSAVYRLARPLARRGVAPSTLTAAAALTGVAAAALAAPGRRRPLLAAAAVGAAGVLDSVDGAVAQLSGRASAWGTLIDSLADRAVDAAGLLALARLGAPPAGCVAAGAALAGLEYARARAAVAGLPDIGLVTVGERPTRLLLAMGATAGAAAVGPPAAGAGSATLTLAAGLGLAQFLAHCRRRLGR